MQPFFLFFGSNTQYQIALFFFLFFSGEILSKDFDCYFSEVAAADQVGEIADAFHELCREVTVSRRKNKTSLLDRVLGNKTGGGLRAYSRGKSDSVLSKD